MCEETSHHLHYHLHVYMKIDIINKCIVYVFSMHIYMHVLVLERISVFSPWFNIQMVQVAVWFACQWKMQLISYSWGHGQLMFFTPTALYFCLFFTWYIFEDINKNPSTKLLKRHRSFTPYENYHWASRQTVPFGLYKIYWFIHCWLLILKWWNYIHLECLHNAK